MEISDKELLNQLKSDDHFLRDSALKYIFLESGWYGLALKHIIDSGLDKAEAEYIIQESLIVFDRNIRREVFSGQSSLRTYFLAIVKMVTFKERRKKNANVVVDPETLNEYIENIGESKEEETDMKQAMEYIISKIDPNCAHILSLYSQGFSHEEIAKEQNKPINMIRVQLSRCREKLKKIILNDPALIEILKTNTTSK